MWITADELNEGYWLHGSEGGRARVLQQPITLHGPIDDGLRLLILTDVGATMLYATDPVEVELA